MTKKQELIEALKHTIGILVIGGYDDRDMSSMISTLKATIVHLEGEDQ
jgi:hypothetical protein